MTIGIVLLNFGEPASSDRERVVRYLERIFRANIAIGHDEPMPRERARTLAERRAPALVSAYDAIDGSPLDRQANEQATALAAELRSRGFDDVVTYVGLQYTDPFVEDAVEQARADGVDTLVGLPVYPLCGPSMTIAALRDLVDAVEASGWSGDLVNVSGWHRHPRYLRTRVDAIRRVASERRLDLHDETTELVFSAHGTPQHYLDEGSRYAEYVTEWCDTVADVLDVDAYRLGFQNHDHCDVAWTAPAIDEVVRDVDAERVVVDPISFLHEQSETLWELDTELRDVAVDAGLEFYRVPVPHDDERLSIVFAELVEPIVAGFDPGTYHLQSCSCPESLDAYCLNC